MKYHLQLDLANLIISILVLSIQIYHYSIIQILTGPYELIMMIKALV